MRKPVLGSILAAAMAAAALSPLPALAAGQGSMVTGTVTSADSESGKIVVNGETYVMDKQAGTAMMPASGDKVSLTYEERGGEKVVTRIGQAAQ